MPRPDDTAGATVRRYRRTDRVAVAYQALRGSRSVEAAHQHELKLRREVLALVAVYRRVGARARGVRLLSDLQGALFDDAPALTSELRREAQAADQLEDHIEHEIGLTGETPALLARWERATVAEVETAQRKLAAIRRRLRELRP